MEGLLMLLRGILLFILLSSVFAMLNAVYKWFGFFQAY